MKPYDELLPNKDELKPVSDKNNTFYGCGFNEEFDKIDFQKKLQVVCDIVRQTIFPNPFPNPLDEIDMMNGDCYTACKVFQKYINKLNICNKCNLFFAIDRPYLGMNRASRHIVVIVDNANKQYLVDPTPYVGYNFGSVIDLSEYKPYNSYLELSDDEESLLIKIQNIRYLDYNNKLDSNLIPEYYEVLSDSLQFEGLRGYSISLIKILKKYSDDYEKIKLDYLILKLDKYNRINERLYSQYLEKEILQIKKWTAQLNELKENDDTAREQLILSQNIVSEYKFLDKNFEKYTDLDGTMYRRSFINPRVLYELNLSQVMIKPSAYYIGVDNKIKEGYIKCFGEPIGEYTIDLSNTTKETGIKPMIFSHPIGTEYIRSMTGNSTIMLFKALPEDTYKLKKYYRKNLCNDLWYKDIIWSDGEPIEWHPFVTNLVHSADNSSESSLHYNIGYPEHQSMTRFMYPNPKLLRKSKCKSVTL